MLDELRSQRDMALELNEHWLLEQASHQKRGDQLEAAFDEVEELKETNRQLKDKLLSHKTEHRQKEADRPMPRQNTEPAHPAEVADPPDSQTVPPPPTPVVERRPSAHSQRESTTLSDRASRTVKLPDPPIFTGSSDPIWEDWSARIWDKMDANSDHYPTEKLRITYAISRLGGEASRQTYSRRGFGSSSSYSTLAELLDELKGIYGDPDQKSKCRREYNALKQINKPFSPFFAEFKQLASFLNYPEDVLMDDLKDKINNRLQDALSICPIKFYMLQDLKDYLQQVDNNQRANYHLRSEQRTAKPMAVSEKRSTPSALVPALVPAATGFARPTSSASPVPDRPRTPVTCYNCKTPGHLTKDCPQPRAATPAPRAFTPRVNEVTTENLEEQEEDYFTEESEDETKN